MENSTSIRALADEIRRIHQSDPADAETLIERSLASRWAGLSEAEVVGLLNHLIAVFEPPATAGGSESLQASILTRIFSLLLGERVGQEEVGSEQQLNRLAESLNIIFDALNELVGVVNTTLYGGRGVGEETIRHVIGSRMKGGADVNSLVGYFDQVKRAFRDSQEAFQSAAHAMVEEILTEFDPERISEEGGGRKFGPFQKAECFKIYERKFEKCRKWFDSGRFAEELAREFERNCYKLSQKQEADSDKIS